MNIPYLDLQALTAFYADELRTAVDKVVCSGRYLQGELVQAFERHYARYIGTTHCVGVANGLDALTLTLRAYREMGVLHDGDEILVPANTFIATVLSITENKLKPVFVDILPHTLDLDLASLARVVTPHTKALMLVHLYGRCTYNETLADFCRKHELLLIEDNAQAHGCLWHERRTGSLGHAACHSFYPGKNLGAMGDAGAVTTDDSQLAEMLRTLSNYGFSEKYIAPFQGRNSRMDEIQAAVLDVKLRHLDAENARRQSLACRYYEMLSPAHLCLPSFMNCGDNVYHIFPVFTPHRDALQRHLHDYGIQTLIHYPVPPHRQACYGAYNHLHLPVAETLATQELSLPLNPTLSDAQAEYIVEQINSFIP